MTAAVAPVQLYMDLLLGTVGCIKAHVEAPGNALLVDLLLEKSGVSFKPSMEELLKVSQVTCWRCFKSGGAAAPASALCPAFVSVRQIATVNTVYSPSTL